MVYLKIPNKTKFKKFMLEILHLGKHVKPTVGA